MNTIVSSVLPSLRNKLQQLKGLLLDLLYPEAALCLSCGKLSDGRPLCRVCRFQLTETEREYRWIRQNLDGIPVWSLRRHRKIARQLVIQLKYNACACAAKELSALLQDAPAAFTERLTPDTVVTWVTMPKGRKRERCIDHGQLLARAFAEELGLPCRQLLLRKEEHGREQARRGGLSRRGNLKHVFTACEPIRFPVLLVDDVITTGTTARRCLEALQAPKTTILTATASEIALSDASGMQEHT